VARGIAFPKIASIAKALSAKRELILEDIQRQKEAELKTTL